GKVELRWNVLPDASGYIILKGNRIINEDYEYAYHVINSGLTNTWDDEDVIGQGETAYHIIAFNNEPEFTPSNSSRRFISNINSVTAEVQRDIKFNVTADNEEVITIVGEYDNSVLIGREYESVNEMLTGGTNGVVHDNRLFASDYIIGNSRLVFNALSLQSLSDGGVGIIIPGMNNVEGKTLELWLDPGELPNDFSSNHPIFLSGQSVNGGAPYHNYLAISKEGILYHEHDQSSEPDVIFNTSILSNEWIHLSFTYTSGKTSIYIDGEYVGEFYTPVNPLNLLGFVKDESQLLTGSAFYQDTRVGLIRMWNEVRTDDQLIADRFDLYTNDVARPANLTNQWNIPKPLNITEIAGLTGIGSPLRITVQDPNNEISLQSEDAFVFDRDFVSRIWKVKTTNINDAFDYKIFDVGSGKLLFNETGDFNGSIIPENLFSLSYDNAPSLKTELGQVDLKYLTGSTLPQEYRLYRSKENENGFSNATLIHTFTPDYVSKSGSYGGATSQKVVLAPVMDEDNATYSIKLKLPGKQLTKDFELAKFGNSIRLVANVSSQLEVVVDASGDKLLKRSFLKTLKGTGDWLEVDVVVAKQGSSQFNVITYLEGQSIDTLDLGSFNPIENRIEINGGTFSPGPSITNFNSVFYGIE
ncbi:MAG: LamG-like jellyroll fold domain-containing protein, partial [Bacteroidota bacterium]